MAISRDNKVRLYNIVSQVWDYIMKNDVGINPLDILDEIWNLRSLSSEDNRFSNAYGDVNQHYFNNDDLTSDQLFLDRLNLYENDERFETFVIKMLSPNFYESETHLREYSINIETILNLDRLGLAAIDFDSRGLPIQTIQHMSGDADVPFGIKKNNITIYVASLSEVSQYNGPFLLLQPTKTWNDFGVVSVFTLFYFDEENVRDEIGRTKIIHETENETWRKMPNKFTQLSGEFCSLSGDYQYYFRLRELFSENGMVSILYAIQDAGFFHDIADKFEQNPNFTHSILRLNQHERMLRELKPKLQGIDLKEQHHFKYAFRPAYSKTPVDVEFNFNDDNPLPNRVFAIIGKNGTGKTQLLTSLPNSFAQKSEKDFLGKIPSFTKIIAVSYSVFDTFNVPKKTGTFNYVYCGLKDEDGDIRSNRGLTLSFHNNWKKIDGMRRMARWREILINFIEPEIVNSFIVRSKDSNRDFIVDTQGFQAVRNQLSSGQSILLFIITQVVANIRVGSLILYDEPETHLHPNAIVELVNTIYNLVNEFESYCLIATHSPLVIREILSKNVFIMQRDKTTASIRRIGIESFGENLGVLNDEVFGDRQMDKQYKSIIRNLIRQGKTFDEIVDLVEFDGVPLSLNARIYINNLINQKNEEL